MSLGHAVRRTAAVFGRNARIFPAGGIAMASACADERLASDAQRYTVTHMLDVLDMQDLRLMRLGRRASTVFERAANADLYRMGSRDSLFLVGGSRSYHDSWVRRMKKLKARKALRLAREAR